MSTAVMPPASGTGLPASRPAPAKAAPEHETSGSHLETTGTAHPPKWKANASSFGVSFTVHALALAGMAMLTQAVTSTSTPVVVESVFTEDRTQQEFSQVLEKETEVSENLTIVSGGTVATQVGGGGLGGTGGGQGGGGTGGTGIGAQVVASTTVAGPRLKIGSGTLMVPGGDMLSKDLGEGTGGGGAGHGVQGEGGAFVEGYGAALGRMTQELIRLMRSEPVMVVWLFDESESMKDDQKEIRDSFHKVYEELGIATKKDAEFKKKGQDVILTSVIGFSDGYHPITQKPTSDIPEIRGAIDKIAIDETGKENMCGAIVQAIAQHHVQAQKQKRKLVIIIVSDESGDDGDGEKPRLEEALDAAKKARSPIYIMGREAIFGYKIARIRWRDPKFNLNHWLPINRGPETPYRECLQWDGLHSRWDSFSSGFGPYEQVRLAKETGGIFFVLPGEEENLSGAGAHEKRQFDALDMKEYEPNLVSRREYQEEVTASKFRSTISKCIEIMDPAKDKLLEIREIHYPLEIDKFKSEALREVQKAQRAMNGLNQVIPMLEDLKPLREKERSQRWRANYDLMLAQCYAYRVRLFQYLLAMDDHANTNPKPTKANSNVWNVTRTNKMIEPDESQFGRLKAAFSIKIKRPEYIEEVRTQETKARELFNFVISEHPRTPWARRAQWELGMGFGMVFTDWFHDPRYQNLGIKLPTL